jgi:hypothetical protein
VPPTETISAFLGVVVDIWAILMARKPREWRHWWCAHLGISDLNTTREQWRRLEGRLQLAAILVGTVAFAVALFAGSAVVWAVGKRDFGAEAPMGDSARSIGANRGINAPR